MKLRSVLLLVVLGIPAVALLAVGPRGRAEVPPGRTVVRYWEKWTGVEGAAMQRIVERFNATVGAEQNIWVDYTAVSNVDQRTLIATAGGDPPDVAGLFDHVVAQFADQGALLPLDDLVRESGIDAAAFKPAWWNIGRYDGRLYALPSAPYTIALYFNKRLFREAGLDPERPPQTTAELTEAAVRLTKRDANGKLVQLGFTLSPAMLGWWHWVWPCFFDATLWDGEQFRVETAEGLAAYEWVARQRVAMGSVGREGEITPDKANADVLAFEAAAGAIESAQNPFLSGRLAMVFQGPWLANWVRAYAPELEYGVAPFPSVSAARQNAFASADVFVIPRAARHPREAMTFLAFLMRQDVMESLCQAHGKVSPYRKPGPEFFRSHPNPNIRVFDDMANSPDAFGYPKMPTWAQAWTETLFMLENVLRRTRTPAEALRLTQTKMDQIVTEYEQMAARRRAGAAE